MRNRVLWRHHSTLDQQSNGHNNRYHSYNDNNTNTEDACKRRRQQEEIDFQRVRCLPLSEILKDESNSAYYDANSPSLVITTPPQRTILDLMNESLVVGYYVALNVALLAVCREVVLHIFIPFIPPSYAYISSSLVTLFLYKWWRGEISTCYPKAICESFLHNQEQ